jgi:serine/alanine adding enzyme
MGGTQQSRLTSAGRAWQAADDALRIERIEPDDDWDAFVAAHPQASLYHHAAWGRLIEELFGHEHHYWCAREGGRIVGVLPLTRLKSRLFGDYMVSLPYVNYGGALADSDGVASRLMQAAADAADQAGSSHVEFRDSEPREAQWSARTDKVAMELELPEDSDALWKQVGSKVRAQVRRPLKEKDVEVATGGVELVEPFYQVFSRNMRDLGTPVYPRRLFERISEEFPQQARIVLVRYQGAPVAAGLLLQYRDRMEIPWASSLQEFNRLGFNMLMYWKALCAAIDAGCRIFDFGRSSADSGTYRFKKQWGAKPRQLYWHYWLADGRPLPNLTPNNPKYRLAIRAWQRLPVPVANLLGPHIVRNLP